MKKVRNFLRGKLFPCALIALLWAAGIALLALYLPRWLAPLAALERLVSLFTGIAVVLSCDTPESKLSKLVLLLLLPWTGAILCILWRRKPRAVTPLPYSDEDEDGILSKAAAYAAPFTGSRITRASGICYFPTGKESFRALLNDILSAQSYIWLEYYIVARGALFNRLFFALRKKAEEGVDVRLLYDGFGSSLTLSAKDVRQLNAAGIHTQEARPLTTALRAVNRRNHRKIAVIDGAIAYTGGVNLADEYTGEKIRFGNWKDTAVRVTGQPAAVFAELIGKTIGKQPPSPAKSEKEHIPCAVIADNAEDCVLRAGAGTVSTLVNSAKKSVTFFTPYLAPDGILIREIKRAVAAGVEVRLMIPHIPDKKLPFLLTRHFARELQKAGAQVREYTDGFLHAKCATADGEYAFVSSYNLDYRSLYLQAECGLLARDEAFAADVERDFSQAWETGTPVPRERFFTRIARMFVQLFLPFL
ncbi:MAG: hypothetical protein K2N84_00575 [Clostridia bacterium]|nr:hypothetical protein [Clostridia bacterium]